MPFSNSGTLDEISTSCKDALKASSSNKNKHFGQLKLHTTGIIGGLLTPPFVVRMCPPLTVKNFSDYRPLLAVGAINGSIQVCFLFRNC